MTRRLVAMLLASSALAACSNSGTVTQNPATFPPATAAATAAATTGSGGGTDVDPNTVAGFCQLMTETITTNWPPKDAAAATLISPLLRNWSSIAAFKDIAPALLAVADWTASMSIMSTVPAPPSDVATAYGQITAFASSHCPG